MRNTPDDRGSSADSFTLPFSPDAFRGKAVLVTGAGHGIGKATAELLASLGAGVAALDIDDERLDRLRDAAAESDSDLAVLHADVCRADDLQQGVDLAMQRWGRLDGVVNNALFAGHGPLADAQPEQMIRAWETNTLAAWRTSKLALPIMTDQGGGSIVNLSTIMVKQIGWAAAPYVSSKAGLEGMTRAMAVELGPKRIRVNAVAPGPIDTRDYRRRDRVNPGVPEDVWQDYRQIHRTYREARQHLMHPWPDRGLPIDVACPIAFLLSDAARFITGATLRVDGGAVCQDRAYDGVDATGVIELRRRLDELLEQYPLLTRRHRQRRAMFDNAVDADEAGSTAGN